MLVRVKLGLLLPPLGLPVHLAQHLLHGAHEQQTQAQQLARKDIVVRAAPQVGPRGARRLTHTPPRPAGQHTEGVAGAPRPAQAPP